LDVKRAIDHMREDYCDVNLGLKDIARAARLSPTRLSAVFKKETGSTVLDYLTNVRIERAKHLLKSGDYMIYEIASFVGYGSSQYFSQVFQKHEGVNPNTYKKGGAE